MAAATQAASKEGGLTKTNSKFKKNALTEAGLSVVYVYKLRPMDANSYNRGGLSKWQKRRIVSARLNINNLSCHTQTMIHSDHASELCPFWTCHAHSLLTALLLIQF